MPLPNFAASHWLDITDASQITKARWNSLKNDIKAQLDPAEVGIEEDNMPAGSINENRIDGEAATKDDPSAGPSEQVITRDTAFTSDLRIGGQEIQDGVLVTAYTGGGDRVLDATDKRLMFVLATDSNTHTITGATGGKEGQVLTVMAGGLTTAGTFIFEHTGGVDIAVDKFSLQGRADFSTSMVSGDRRASITFIYTDYGGRFTNKHWSEIYRRTG